jgi:DNA-directed RNA polymerase subunit E'/Rpb7
MTSTITFDTDILVEPVYFNDIVTRVTTNVNSKYLNKCTKNWGHILKILNIDIKDNKIAPSDSMVIFIVECKIQNLKPVAGDTVRGRVTMIKEYGLMVDILNLNKQPIFVATKDLNGYTYCQNDGSYKREDTGDIIDINDELEVRVQNVRYMNCLFNCSGKFVRKI